MNRKSGFTLLELLVAIAVLGILAAVAVPSFVATIQQNRAASEVNEFLSLLYFTRSEAVKRNRRMIMCKSTDGTSCASGSERWDQGLLIFEDTDADNALDAGEPIVRAQVPLSTGSTITGNTNVANFVRYDALGKVHAQGTFTIDPGKTEYKRTVVINVTGRPYAG